MFSLFRFIIIAHFENESESVCAIVYRIILGKSRNDETVLEALNAIVILNHGEVENIAFHISNQ